MPERQSIIMYDSAEVQGEGSWIKVRLISHGESKRIMRDYGGLVGKSVDDVGMEKFTDMQAANDELISSKVVSWNWVNDEGQPLPLPQDDPAVLDELTEAEHQFIAKAMRGEGERKK